MKGERRGPSDEEEKRTFFWEWGLMIAFFVVGLILTVERIRAIKRVNKKQKEIEERMGFQDDDHEDEEGITFEIVPGRKVRLSERECKGLSMDELERIDRSSNYVLPLEYKRRVEEYRTVYKIPVPEDPETIRKLAIEKELVRLQKVREARKLQLQQSTSDSNPSFNYKEIYDPPSK